MKNIASYRIRKLVSDILCDHHEAVDQFWKELEDVGTPIVERCLDDKNFCHVTFLWRGEGNECNVAVSGFLDGGPAEDPTRNQMTRIPGTSIWFRTYKLPSDSIFAYYIVPNDPVLLTGDWEVRHQFLRKDPLNQLEYRRYPGTPLASVARLPDAYIDPTMHEVRTGNLQMNQFYSTVLDQSRPVWIYTPHAYNEDTNKDYPLVIFFDGEAYLDFLKIDVTLDRLIQLHQIPPIVAVMVGNVNHQTRIPELSCNDQFRDFITDELMPWIFERYQVSKNASDITLCGISMGALSAAWIAHSRPNVCGNVISQSGAFWWSPEVDQESDWFTRRVVKSNRVPVRFYIEAGVFETNADPRYNLLQSNRRLRDVLQAKGYDVTYSEFNGGHDDQSWGHTIIKGLTSVVGGYNHTAR